MAHRAPFARDLGEYCTSIASLRPARRRKEVASQQRACHSAPANWSSSKHPPCGCRGFAPGRRRAVDDRVRRGEMGRTTPCPSKGPCLNGHDFCCGWVFFSCEGLMTWEPKAEEAARSIRPHVRVTVRSRLSDTPAVFYKFHFNHNILGRLPTTSRGCPQPQIAPCQDPCGFKSRANHNPTTAKTFEPVHLSIQRRRSQRIQGEAPLAITNPFRVIVFCRKYGRI